MKQCLCLLLILCVGTTAAPADEPQIDRAAVPVDAQRALPVVDPATLGMSARRLAAIDDIVSEGLSRGKMPGCVVVVGHRGKIVYRKAFGFRQLLPDKVPMTVDTVFDMASITKPVVTATCVMLLVEDGKVDVDQPVATYLPEFAAGGKQEITVRQLLTHMGGLIPDNHIRDYADGRERAIERIHALEPWVEPGTRFAYTDVGFIVLGELIQRISGQPLNEFVRQRVFDRLQMNETGYLPGDALRRRCAVTQQRDGKWMQGDVHDPRAWALGGVAGHAGLFSTADDLARYCQMLLNEGQWNGESVIQPATVKLMRSPQKVSSGLRTLGWDMKSPYSSNRGDLMSVSAFGHGGFTGTAMWIDPQLDLFVIFLSNRVHPDGKGSVNALAGRIATVSAAAMRMTSDE
ncbi:MAG: beta-lactamase family protein [Planctomycetaceae bacterium]|nr:beta-lactamase family protein [Planctomycetaceae bacterium]